MRYKFRIFRESKPRYGLGLLKRTEAVVIEKEMDSLIEAKAQIESVVGKDSTWTVEYLGSE